MLTKIKEFLFGKPTQLEVEVQAAAPYKVEAPVAETKNAPAAKPKTTPKSKATPKPKAPATPRAPAKPRAPRATT